MPQDRMRLNLNPRATYDRDRIFESKPQCWRNRFTRSAVSLVSGLQNPIFKQWILET